MKDTTSKMFGILYDEGPQYIEHPTTELRMEFASKFNPSSQDSGSSLSGTGQTTPIWFLREEHSKEEVIRKWLDINEENVECLPDWSLHHRISNYGNEFKEASKEILGPFESMKSNGGNHNTGGECPLCGYEYSRALPDHLPCDE